jgi:hypothetical protein
MREGMIVGIETEMETAPVVSVHEDVEGSTTARRRGWMFLIALMAGFAAVFVATYPPIAGIEDEIGYLNQALVWSRGAITAEGAGYDQLGGFWPVDGRNVAIRQPGRSLVALPFLMLGGLRAVFASGLLIHLATAAVAGATLARLGRSPAWAALVLFHPTLALYSRTVMADPGAGLGLLVAAWAVAGTESRLAGVWAGLGVGLAALMRYHAGVALPFVAAAFVWPPARADRWRQAILCLIVGGACGAAIVGYNLMLYHHPTDPNPAMRGFFSARFVAPNLLFYGASLMAIWPGMLPAPLLDRSPLRVMARGVCGFFLAFFLFYYWYDRGGSWAETLVLGQRLLSVALPVWIVSYAGVVDDLVAAPIGRRIGPHASWAVALLGGLALLAATGLMFGRHERHLDDLLDARAEVARLVPDGAVVGANGTVAKLFGVPTQPPFYRWIWVGEPPAGTWYLAYLAKSPGDAAAVEARSFAERYRMTPVPSGRPDLLIYVSTPSPGPQP